VFPAMEQPEAVRAGVVDITWNGGSFCAGMVPVGNAVGLLSMAAPERREKGIDDLLIEAFREQNLYWLMHLDASGYDENYRVFLNSLIEKPEDLEGLRIRAVGFYKPLIEYFGAIPISIPGAETYNAMERGLMDGFAFPANAPVFNFGMQEVTKYYISPGFGSEQIVWLFNLDSWNRIPLDLQKVIKDAVLDVESDWVDKMYATHVVWVDKFKAAGMKEIKFSPEDGERFVKAFYDASWADAIKKDPKYSPRLRELLEK